MSYDESPQLPHGYGLVLMTATDPPTWSKIMDPLVDSYNNNDDKKEKERVAKISDLELKKYWVKMVSTVFVLWAITWLKMI